MARVGVARGRGGFYIDGLTEARASLAALPEAFKEIAAETIDIGTNIILTEAVARVPVRHGNLKRSLAKNTRDDGLEVSVGSSDWKAKFQEFGTNDTPRQPFLWPAYRLGTKYIRQRMKEWGKEAARKVTVRSKSSSAVKSANKRRTAWA